MEKTIVHLDLDCFFVSVECLLHSELKGKPVIIGGLSDRGVVASCSYEARKYGVRSAMPMKMARILCKDAVVIRGDMEQYSKYSHIVTEIIAEKAPVYEKASIDEHYLDISGMDRFFGCAAWTKELRMYIIKNTGLPISFGLSINKTVAKIATGESKPDGELIIGEPLVKPFLHPLPVGRIPMVGDKTNALLRSMGIGTIGLLSTVPVYMLEGILGKNGRELWKKANGIDLSPVKPYSERKSISTERTFDKDTTDLAFIHTMISKMIGELGYDLRTQQKLTSCITVKIRYSNFDTYTRQKRVPYTSLDCDLLQTAKELFAELHSRRMLIRLIGIRLSHLVNGLYQPGLFDDSARMISLYNACDRMRNRYGKKAVRTAITL